LGATALIAGFGSPAHLNKAFKKAFGMTLGELGMGN